MKKFILVGTFLVTALTWGQDYSGKSCSDCYISCGRYFYDQQYNGEKVKHVPPMCAQAPWEFGKCLLDRSEDSFCQEGGPISGKKGCSSCYNSSGKYFYDQEYDGKKVKHVPAMLHQAGNLGTCMMNRDSDPFCRG